MVFLHQGPVPDVKDEDVNVIHVFLQMFLVVIGQQNRLLIFVLGLFDQQIELFTDFGGLG